MTSKKINEFCITQEKLLEILNSPVCEYKNLKTPIIVRHHGRSVEEASTFDMLKGYPNIVMLAKDPVCAKEVLDVYPDVKWAKEYYTDGVLCYTQKGDFQYCRDNGSNVCVLLEDDLRDFTVSFYGTDNKMHISSTKYFPTLENPELTKRILAYCIRRAEALFKKHPDVGMIGWHHRAFGYLYQNCNTVDINGGYNDYANGYIYNVAALDKYGFELPLEYDRHGENVGTYCGILNCGMQLACFTGSNISPNNDGDKSTLRTDDNTRELNTEDLKKVLKLTPAVFKGIRQQKQGGNGGFIKISWKNMNAVTGKEHKQERLFYNPDDKRVEDPSK